MKPIFSYKDGALGFLNGVVGVLPALLTFAFVACVLAGLWITWKSVTLVSIRNQSDVSVHDLELSHKPYEGEEEFLWRVSLGSKQSTVMLSRGCCWRLVVRYQSREASCRYPSSAPATFVVVVDEELGLACGGFHRELWP